MRPDEYLLGKVVEHRCGSTMEYSPLRNKGALREAEVSEIEVSLASARVAVLFDLRTSLQLWDLGAAGLLVFDGVSSCISEWPSERCAGRYATSTLEMVISAISERAYRTELTPVFDTSGRLSVVSSAISFLLLDSEALSAGSAPPDFQKSDGAQMVRGVPRMAMEYEVVSADFLH